MSEYIYYVQKIYQPSPDLVVIEVGDKRGLPVFLYRPGQYAMISYKNTRGTVEDKHAFSIASSPNQKRFIRFGIRILGDFTKGLLNLKEGDDFYVSGPYGKFSYDENKYFDLVMIAGGIGITPFISTLNYASDNKIDNKLSLIYSSRSLKGATFYDEIKNIEKYNPNISALFSLTDESGKSPDKDVIFRRIDAQMIKDYIGNVYGKTFFICGPSAFMAAMTANLLSIGVEKDQIQTEEFIMIPDKAFFSRVRNISYALAFSILVFVISFSLIHKSNAAIIKRTYDPNTVSKLNQVAYDRMLAIYADKNKAITDLNAQILAATKTSGTAKTITTTSSSQNSQLVNTPKPTSSNTPSPVVVSTPVIQQPVQTPVYVPPVYTPPTPAPAPTPTTRVS